MNNDLVEQAFAVLEVDSPDPSQTFAAELRSQFIEVALGQPDSFPVRRPQPFMQRPLAALAGAAVVAAAVALAVLVAPSSSALAIVQEARQQFSQLPAFRAVVEKVIPADQLAEEVGSLVSDWRMVTEISFRDDRHWRRQTVLDDSDPFSAGSQVGSYQVFSGDSRLVYDASSNTFVTESMASVTAEQARKDALNELSPSLDQGDPVSDQAVRSCQVLDRDQIAGRDAHHFGCSADAGDGTISDGVEAWIDMETGVVLKLILPNGIRFEVTDIEYDVTFDPGVFSTEPPGDAVPAGAFLDTGLDIGDEVPTWSLPLAGGGHLDLAALRGRPTVVYIWATWCGDVCYGGSDDPLDALDEATVSLGSDLNFVSLAVSDTISAVQAVADEGGHSHLMAVSENSIGGLWGANGVPSIVIIDLEGRLVGAYLGDVQGEDVRRVLTAVADEQPLPELGGQTVSQLRD